MVEAFDECLDCTKHWSTCGGGGGHEAVSLTSPFQKELAFQLQGKQLSDSLYWPSKSASAFSQGRALPGQSPGLGQFLPKAELSKWHPLFWSFLLSRLRLYRMNIMFWGEFFLILLPPHFSFHWHQICIVVQPCFLLVSGSLLRWLPVILESPLFPYCLDVMTLF